jgi:hypothetical protein
MATANRPGGRKRATPARKTTTDATTTAALTCPECGRTFSRPAALGAHRSRVHGVAGTSQNARSRRNAAARKAATTAPRRARRAAPASTRTATRASNGGVDHDALLRALFPDGIPPRQTIVGAVNDWLDQADRLAGQR